MSERTAPADSIPVVTEPTETASNATAPSGGLQVTIQNFEEYKNEVVSMASELRQRSAQLGESGPVLVQSLQGSFQPTKEYIVNSLSDLSPPAALPVAEISRAFSFATVVLVASFVASIFGAYFGGPILSFFLLKFGAVILVVFTIPFFGYINVYAHVNAKSSDGIQRLAVALIGAGQGFLTGFVLNSLYMTQPLVFLTPLVVSFVGPLAASALAANRVHFLGALGGVPLALHLFLGVISGNLSAGYFLLAVLYSVIAVAVVQLIIADGVKARENLSLHILHIVVGSHLAKLIIFALLSSADANPAVAPKK